MSFMMMLNQADKERQDKDLEMCRLELNAQWEENRAQNQMMQMMMANLMSSNNPNSFIGQNIEESVAPGIGKAVELGEVNEGVNAAGNFNTHKDDKKV